MNFTKLVLSMFIAAVFSTSVAKADMIGISCSKDPSNPNSKSIAGMGSEGLEPRSMKYVNADYRGKKFSDRASITTIRNAQDKIVRYIVSEGTLTLVFSHLEKCGDEMSGPEDFVKLTVTKTVRGEKQVLEKLACSCDID